MKGEHGSMLAVGWSRKVERAIEAGRFSEVLKEAAEEIDLSVAFLDEHEHFFDWISIINGCGPLVTEVYCYDDSGELKRALKKRLDSSKYIFVDVDR
jgi:hypothetical protein